MRVIQRVKDGAAFLSTIDPHWKINPLITDIGNERVCALAQVSRTIYKKALKKNRIPLAAAVKYGFQSDARHAILYRVEYIILSIVWRLYVFRHPQHRTFKKVLA